MNTFTIHPKNRASLAIGFDVKPSETTLTNLVNALESQGYSAVIGVKRVHVKGHGVIKSVEVSDICQRHIGEPNYV